MSNRDHHNGSVTRRAIRRLGSAERFAAVAAGGGDPAGLLALEGHRRAADTRTHALERPSRGRPANRRAGPAGSPAR